MAAQKEPVTKRFTAQGPVIVNNQLLYAGNFIDLTKAEVEILTDHQKEMLGISQGPAKKEVEEKPDVPKDKPSAKK